MERKEMSATFDNLDTETRERLRAFLNMVVSQNQNTHLTGKFTFGGQMIEGDIASFAYLAGLTVLQLLEHPLDLSEVNKITYTDETGMHVLLDPDVEEPKKLSVEIVPNEYGGTTLKIKNL